MKKALIAMSGGVDSSVAAKLTQEAGFDCIGCTMKLFDPEDAGLADYCALTPDGPQRTCCSIDDVEDARKVAERLGMPYYVFNFRQQFRSCVMDKFVESYSHGRTPNPCIDCNRYLKFAELLQRARELGCEYIVTGHYARIERDEETGKYLLRKGLDPSKDQSYVLYTLTQEQLAHTLFPLGALNKTEVRELAGGDGFVNADKPDSQDICFVPDGDYAAMIRNYTGREFPEGDYVDPEGNVIGRHKGIINYTIGQHKHLGKAFGEKRYVCRIDADKNQVVLGRNEDVFSSYAKVSDVNWISGEAPSEDIRCRVRVRYKQKEQWATVRPCEDGSGGNECGCGAGGSGCGAEIFFDEPQRAITPGQAAVFYDGDIVLGGGTLI